MIIMLLLILLMLKLKQRKKPLKWHNSSDGVVIQPSSITYFDIWSNFFSLSIAAISSWSFWNSLIIPKFGSYSTTCNSSLDSFINKSSFFSFTWRIPIECSISTAEFFRLAQLKVKSCLLVRGIIQKHITKRRKSLGKLIRSYLIWKIIQTSRLFSWDA